MKAALTIPEAAHYTGLREHTLIDLVEKGHIYYRRVGKTILFLQSELDTWFSELPGNHPDVAKNTDTSVEANPVNVPSVVPDTPPVTLVRGARTHVSAASALPESR